MTNTCWMRTVHFQKPAFACAGLLPQASAVDLPAPRTMEPDDLPRVVPDNHAGEFKRREFGRGTYELWLAGKWRQVNIIKTGERFLTAIVNGAKMTLHDESFFVAPGYEPRRANSESDITNVTFVDKQQTFEFHYEQCLWCGMSESEATRIAMEKSGIGAAA